MASATLIPPSLSHTSSPLPKVSKAPHFIASLSTSPHSYPKNQIFRSLTSIPQLGLASISSWNGLRRTGFSISLNSLRFEKRKKKVGKGVFASLFGVGAPEALVIGVVALLVFGPKGLADVAKNLGKTLRTFQPTIRELQEVSREFKSTLEKEIGIDELQNPLPRKPSNIPTFSPSQNSPATTTETAAATTSTTTTTTEDSQATPETPVTVTEDSQATPETPVAVAEDSQATPETPVADTEESQANASPPAATTGDSQVVATTPAVTTNGFDQ